MSISRKRVAILISGRGSNMAALIAAAADPHYPAEIVGVISDKADAAGLGLAAARGVPTQVIARADHAGKGEHDAAIDAALAKHGAEIVALAGYMRLLTTPFVEKWQGRMVNIHPALLPSFKGLDTHRRALEAGMRVHGCTVHFVTPEMDDGPIIAQAAVPVMLGDDADALAARQQGAEQGVHERGLAGAGRAGDADDMGTAEVRRERGDEVVRTGRTVLDAADRARHGAALALQQAARQGAHQTKACTWPKPNSRRSVAQISPCVQPASAASTTRPNTLSPVSPALRASASSARCTSPCERAAFQARKASRWACIVAGSGRALMARALPSSSTW